MNRRLSADTLRIAAASFALALGSFQVFADTPEVPASSPASSSTAGPVSATPASGNPTQLTSGAATDGSTASSGTATPPRHRRHSRHGSAASPTFTSNNNNLASSWPSLTQPATDSTSASPSADLSHASGDSASTEAGGSSKVSTESRVADWMPRSTSAPTDVEADAGTARIDLIADRYGKQATVDFNSRVQEANGVIAFRAIDNQTGELETIRIDRSGDIKLKSGWPH